MKVSKRGSGLLSAWNHRVTCHQQGLRIRNYNVLAMVGHVYQRYDISLKRECSLCFVNHNALRWPGCVGLDLLQNQATPHTIFRQQSNVSCFVLVNVFADVSFTAKLAKSIKKLPWVELAIQSLSRTSLRFKSYKSISDFIEGCSI